MLREEEVGSRGQEGVRGGLQVKLGGQRAV